jgi:hypothetical protein
VKEKLFERVLPLLATTSWPIWLAGGQRLRRRSRACAPRLAAEPWDALRRWC